MKQMGVKMKRLDVKEVVFLFEDGTRWIFRNPEVVETEAMGNKAFQVIGSPEEDINEEDIKIIMEKTGVDRERALEALKKSKGDIAEAILMLESQ